LIAIGPADEIHQPASLCANLALKVKEPWCLYVPGPDGVFTQSVVGRERRERVS
jgi:hypothetical protein